MAAITGLEENYQRWAVLTCTDTENPIPKLNSIFVTGLRVTFDIKKGPKLKDNKAVIKVYNMSPDSRGFVQLPLDNFRLPTLQVQLDVGYGEEEKLIFLGRGTAESVWEAPNWVTTITATDGDVQFDLFQYEKKFPGGTPIVTIVTDILTQSGLAPGKSLPISGVLKKSRTFSGPPLLILQNLQSTYGFVFDIQDGKYQVVPGGAAIVDSTIIKLDFSSGLIGTPRVKDELVVVDMLINPDVKPGTFIQLLSIEDITLSGVYLVKKMTFKGDNWGSTWLANVEIQDILKNQILSLDSTPVATGNFV